MQPLVIRTRLAKELRLTAMQMMVYTSIIALVGGATAHYRADPGSFYGIDLTAFFPSNILRTWHLQLAIFWIATAYVAGALLLAAEVG